MLILEKSEVLVKLLGMDGNGRKIKINKLPAICFLILIVAFIMLSIATAIKNFQELELVTSSIKEVCGFSISFTFFIHYWINFGQFDSILIELQRIVNESKSYQ